MTTTAAELDIRNALSRYALFMDLGQLDQLSEVFTEDVAAKYSEPFGNLDGLPVLREALRAATAHTTSHHSLGTVIIEFKGDDVAETMSYFTANIFGKGSHEGKVVIVYGRYVDKLKKTAAGWRIYNREHIVMGPMVGDTSIFPK